MAAAIVIMWKTSSSDKRMRRTATRHDKLAEVFLNFILAASIDWI
jgi:hypothetical protein